MDAVYITYLNTSYKLWIRVFKFVAENVFNNVILNSTMNATMNLTNSDKGLKQNYLFSSVFLLL